MPTNTPRFSSFLSGLAFEEGKAAAILRWISVLRLIKAQLGPRSWRATRLIRRRPTPGGRFLLKQGRERKRRTKAVRVVPYQCLRGRVEKRETETGQAPGIPPERLLNCVSTPSRRAPRLMEPARGVPPINAALPPAVGQWRRAFLGRGRSRLLSLAVVCGLGLVWAILAALGP